MLSPKLVAQPNPSYPAGGGWHGRALRREVVLARLLATGPRSRGGRGCQRVLRHVWAVLAGGGGVLASGGRGGLGGAGVVEAVRLRGGRRAAGAVHRQGGRRSHAAQVPAVQGVPVQFIDRVLNISVAHREGTYSANCAEDRACGRRPCDQQRQFPQSRGSNPRATFMRQFTSIWKNFIFLREGRHPRAGSHWKFLTNSIAVFMTAWRLMVLRSEMQHFSRSSRSSRVERHFSGPSMAKSSLPSRAPLPIKQRFVNIPTLRSHFGSSRGYPQRISAAWGTVRCHLEQAKEVHSDFAESL